MSDHELFAYIGAQTEQKPTSSTNTNVVEFSDDVLAHITVEQANAVVERFGAHVFMRLPAGDVEFFEWLKTAAPNVWEDLWGSDEPSTELGLEPYIVGIGLLPQLIKHDRGYPICDLVNEPNFYFSVQSLNAEEAKPFVDAVVARFESGKDVPLEQALILEIRREPIDVWRFAYMYNLPVEAVKRAAQKLIQDGLLKNGSTRDELSEFIEL